MYICMFLGMYIYAAPDVVYELAKKEPKWLINFALINHLNVNGAEPILGSLNKSNLFVYNIHI